MAGPVASRPAGGAELSIDQRSLVRAARQIRQEADGKELRKQLLRHTKAALDPAAQQVRGAILAMPSSGDPRKGPPLRQAIAAKVKVQVRLSGRTPGASIKVQKIKGARGFPNAPKRTNRRAGWRHPVWGHGWAHQTGKPGWFDDTLKKNRDDYRKAVLSAVDEMSRQMANRLRSL
jgi:hypothetical protein